MIASLINKFLNQLLWLFLTTTIIILFYGAENIEKWLSKPVTEIRIVDILMIILYALSFIYIFYDNTKK